MPSVQMSVDVDGTPDTVTFHKTNFRVYSAVHGESIPVYLTDDLINTVIGDTMIKKPSVNLTPLFLLDNIYPERMEPEPEPEPEEEDTQEDSQEEEEAE